MRNLREAILQKRPDLWKNKHWLLHHENGSAHSSFLVRKFSAKNNNNDAAVAVFPISGPCDFFLFQKLKEAHESTTLRCDWEDKDGIEGATLQGH